MKNLTFRQRYIVARWRQGLTLREIGYEVDLSHERVRQILQRLKRRPELSGYPARPDPPDPPSIWTPPPLA